VRVVGRLHRSASGEPRSRVRPGDHAALRMTPAQAATAYQIRPRSSVGPEGGLSAGGVPLGPIGVMANAITALPRRLRS